MVYRKVLIHVSGQIRNFSVTKVAKIPGNQCRMASFHMIVQLKRQITSHCTLILAVLVNFWQIEINFVTVVASEHSFG